MIRLKLDEISVENSKTPAIYTKLRTKIVIPDQGEIWRRRSWRYKEKVDVSFFAHFIAHHEIWSKTTFHT